MTGGTTTGLSKEAPHQPSLFAYLAPFHAFLVRLSILNYRTAYIATPICHGYGLAVLLLMCAAGRKAVIRRGFEAEQACRCIREHRAEAAVVVPVMLQRMLRANPEALRTLACIASGGAELGPKLAEETRERLGPVLYNLYGTSEAGLALIAAPEDLARSPRTIGRPIPGVRVRIADRDGKEAGIGQVGRIEIQRLGTTRRKADRWIGTGDLGYRDEQGYYFLRGRSDSMIVSGGENVYPLEVEQVLLTHPRVEDAAVIGVADDAFGMRLKAFVQPTEPAAIAEEELRAWLQGELARYQMPREIVFVERLPYTPLGKLDRKRLR
jgi:acyl-CoA synthetase (AMP-forming)/AMP-acid ligase II